MLKGVRTAALRCDGRGVGPHSANRLYGTRSRLEGKQIIYFPK